MLLDPPPPPPFPDSPETIKFLYSSLHRVDNLVRRYHSLRTESNSQANLLAHLSSRLSHLAQANLARTTIEYHHILCPPVGRMSLVDRMAISLKENLDRVMVELDTGLTEMELVYMSVDDTLVTLCRLVNSLEVSSGELVNGVKHVQQVYLTLVDEVRGTPATTLVTVARRDLWYRFTADEKRKSILSASTLGDFLQSPASEWEEFANEWTSLGNKTDEVDDLAIAMGSWGVES